MIKQKLIKIITCSIATTIFIINYRCNIKASSPETFGFIYDGNTYQVVSEYSHMKSDMVYCDGVCVGSFKSTAFRVRKRNTPGNMKSEAILVKVESMPECNYSNVKKKYIGGMNDYSNVTLSLMSCQGLTNYVPTTSTINIRETNTGTITAGLGKSSVNSSFALGFSALYTEEQFVNYVKIKGNCVSIEYDYKPTNGSNNAEKARNKSLTNVHTSYYIYNINTDRNKLEQNQVVEGKKNFVTYEVGFKAYGSKTLYWDGNYDSCATPKYPYVYGTRTYGYK